MTCSIGSAPVILNYSKAEVRGFWIMKDPLHRAESLLASFSKEAGSREPEARGSRIKVYGRDQKVALVPPAVLAKRRFLAMTEDVKSVLQGNLCGNLRRRIFFTHPQPPRPGFAFGILSQVQCSGHPSFKKEGKLA